MLITPISPNSSNISSNITRPLTTKTLGSFILFLHLICPRVGAHPQVFLLLYHIRGCFSLSVFRIRYLQYSQSPYSFPYGQLSALHPTQSFMLMFLLCCCSFIDIYLIVGVAIKPPLILNRLLTQDLSSWTAH